MSFPQSEPQDFQKMSNATTRSDETGVKEETIADIL
jgi:hypothetical protein